ncbi:MAG: 50S ribosomal protein L29 [Clostridiales bacterium]|nr:50S ribosomal protein L29 [Clostridiales bacterium]
MKVSEIREMTSEQLNNKLKELKEELFNLRFQLAINQLENTNRIGEVKKDIARVMTVLNDKNEKNA